MRVSIVHMKTMPGRSKLLKSKSKTHFSKLHYAAAQRNSQPILNALQTILDNAKPNLKLLEISSGSEYDRNLLTSIQCWINDCQTKNICSPMLVNILSPHTEWGSNPSSSGPYVNGLNNTDFKDLTNQFDYILNINMIHITPFECTENLFRNSSNLLKSNGLLITYGPYSENGKITPQSNVDFDRSLKSNDPRWGVRDLTILGEFCKQFGFEFQKCIEMPANNKTCVWKKVR